MTGLSEPPKLRLLCGARLRQPGPLPDRLAPLLPREPTLDELTAELDHCDPQKPLWLAGGEPTLRADLPNLIERAARHSTAGVGLISDGLALAREQVVQPLQKAGLQRVRLTLHSARADAHDWLVGRPGATRTALRALKTLMAAGISCELAATVTRPTLPHLDELVALAAELKLARLHLLRLRTDLDDRATLVMLAPRFGLLSPQLEPLARQASLLGVPLSLHDFPRCTTGSADRFRVTQPARWLLPQGDEWDPARHALAPEPTLPGCTDCPGAPECRGAPAGYVARFGRGELLSGDPLKRRVPTPDNAILRVRFGGPQTVACNSCGDAHHALLEPEPTRVLRLRLVQAAQQGARVLRVASASSLSHPQAASLLRECTLLFDRVEVAGEASALDSMDEAELYALKSLARVDAALYGPDPETHDRHVGHPGAFEAALRGLKRLHTVAGVEIGSYAVLHDANLVEAFAQAWAEGHLPGSPRFRLSPEGGSLRELAQTASRLTPDAQQALARVLPASLLDRSEDTVPLLPSPGLAFTDAPQPDEAPSGSDILGTFSPCTCEPAPTQRCPGIATGWSHM